MEMFREKARMIELSLIEEWVEVKPGSWIWLKAYVERECNDEDVEIGSCKIQSLIQEWS
jgi:glyoxylate utilization-related uncharacterized protein